MDAKYINRYHSFCSSLESLEKAKTRDSSDEFVISGTIQKFNLTFDISWKVMKDIIVKYHQILDFATGSPRETLRIAHSVRLIEDDEWMRMLKLRNELAHDYDGELAKASFDEIIGSYLSLFQKFREEAKKYITE